MQLGWSHFSSEILNWDSSSVLGANEGLVQCPVPQPEWVVAIMSREREKKASEGEKSERARKKQERQRKKERKKKRCLLNGHGQSKDLQKVLPQWKRRTAPLEPEYRLSDSSLETKDRPRRGPWVQECSRKHGYSVCLRQCTSLLCYRIRLQLWGIPVCVFS